MEANAPTLRADKNQLERVQRLTTRLVRGHRHVPYEERLRQVKHFSLERRRLRADLTLAFKIFKGEVDLYPSESFLRPPQAGLRAHTYRFLQGPSRFRRRSGAFSVRMVKYWSRLPAHLELAPSVSIFKKQLDRHWFEIFPAAPVYPLGHRVCIAAIKFSTAIHVSRLHLSEICFNLMSQRGVRKTRDRLSSLMIQHFPRRHYLT